MGRGEKGFLSARAGAFTGRKRGRRAGPASLEMTSWGSGRVELSRLAHVGDFDAEGGGEIDLVILFLHQDLTDLFG